MSNENLIQNATLLGMGDQQRAANIAAGGQLGVGYRAANLDAATPLVFPPVTLVVLQTPTMYSKRSGASGNDVSKNITVGQMIKTLIEGHAKSVSGIDFGYTLETAEQPVGHDGQQMQVPTKTKRSQVSPSFVFPEVTGNLVYNLFRQWITDIQDPDTNASMARFHDVEDIVFMSSYYSMSMIAIQYDPTFLPKNIIDAAFYTNMFPIDPGGQIGFERQISTSKTMGRTVNFTGLVQHNKATRALGVKIAADLKLAQANYDNAPTATSETAKDLQDSGLKKELDELLGEDAATT